MYWLWKWLESYNNCTFSTWKDKFLFNLLFWISKSFCPFHDYGREGTPLPTWRPVTDFLLFRFLKNCLALKNRVALKLFTVLKYFLSFRTFEQLVLALKTEFALKFSSQGGGSLTNHEKTEKISAPVQRQARFHLNFKENVFWNFKFRCFLWQRNGNTANKVWLFSGL